MKAIPYETDPERLPFWVKKVWDVTRPAYDGGPCCHYSCPDECWTDHLDAWRRQRRDGNKTAPSPMPFNHCMFTDPLSYGCVPWGCTDAAIVRKAWEVHHRANLVGGGWTRGMKEEEVERIVQAATDASFVGQDLGAAPYLACVWTTALR